MKSSEQWGNNDDASRWEGDNDYIMMITRWLHIDDDVMMMK